MDTDQQFGWRAVKAATNRGKHKVTFDEAATVFADPLFITVIDDEHSMDEERHITIGMSSRRRLLLIAHTERDGRIWIISAREATMKEERFYAEAE